MRLYDFHYWTPLSSTFRSRLGSEYNSTQPAVDTPDGVRVVYAHADGLTELYENRTEGIAHEFIIAERPTDFEADASIGVIIEVEGLAVRPADEGALGIETLELVDPVTGTAILHYGAIKAWDANGRVLATHYEVNSNGMRIIVADAGAAYPVTIDPLITSLEAKPAPDVTGDGASSDALGRRVAAQGDTVAIGSPEDDTLEIDTGSVYVFVRNGSVWTRQAKLTAPDGVEGDNFGTSVAISGETVLVGATSPRMATRGSSGRVYVFVRSGSDWSQQAELRSSDNSLNDHFGAAVALNEGTAVVGAPNGNLVGTSYAGAAYVFNRDGTAWTEAGKLVAGDLTSTSAFGRSVAVSGKTILIGSNWRSGPNNQGLGVAYVFLESGVEWRQQARLIASDGTGGLANTPSSPVALSGDTALIGAPGDDIPGGFGNLTDGGRAYVFVRDGATWSQQAVLEASSSIRDADDHFGASVALDGGTALIGAPNYQGIPGGIQRGAAYAFVRTGTSWNLETKLLASDAADFDIFGSSVALSGDTLRLILHRRGEAGAASPCSYMGRPGAHRASYTLAMELLVTILASPWR